MNERNQLPADYNVNLRAEKRITLANAAKHFGVHRATVFRWAKDGVKGHKLKTFNVGGKMFTTFAEVKRFGDKIASGPASSA
jgi:Protein of unknown function (DUF1580)